MNIINFKNSLNALAELGWHEINTTNYIVHKLKDSPIKRGFMKGNTGLLYKVGAGSEGILLRADIDALKNSKGVAHTCGHSTHMASLMGAHFYAKQREKELIANNKSIYFLFQPAEETFPSGAQAFTHECSALLKHISSAYSLHVRPLMKLGTVGLQPYLLWARGDYMEIEIHGKMVHIKNNLKGKDALFASALLIQGMSDIQKKYRSIRIGIGVASGGRQANTVADYAILKGDIRLPNDEWQPILKTYLASLVHKVEKKTRCSITLKYFDGIPSLINNERITKNISHFLKKNTQFKIKSKGLFSYGCEDFAYISHRVPSVVALIGTGDMYDLHEENCTISDSGTINAYLYFKSLIDQYLTG